MKTKTEMSWTYRVPSWPLATLVLATLFAWGQPMQAGTDPRIMPPTAKVEGISLPAWNQLFMEYGLKNSSPNGWPPFNRADVEVGQVVIMAQSWGDNPWQLTVRNGTFLMFPIYYLWGELYDDDSIDNPDDWAWWHSQVKLTLTLDGSPIQANFADYFVPTTTFSPPLEYAEPSEYGSIGAVWFQGWGCIIKPLKPGVHVLTNRIEDSGADWTDTYIITVTK